MFVPIQDHFLFVEEAKSKSASFFDVAPLTDLPLEKVQTYLL